MLVVTLASAKHRALIVTGIVITIGSCGPAWASFGVNHLDVGGHYAGILMGMSNAVASTPGFIVPLLTGYIVQDPTVSVRDRSASPCFECHFVDQKRVEHAVHHLDLGLRARSDVLRLVRVGRTAAVGVGDHR